MSRTSMTACGWSVEEVWSCEQDFHDCLWVECGGGVVMWASPP